MKKPAYGCGLEAALDVVGGKWKVLILWHLASEPAGSANCGGSSPASARRC